MGLGCDKSKYTENYSVYASFVNKRDFFGTIIRTTVIMLRFFHLFAIYRYSEF
jgi:hypothetical protein